MKYGCDRFTIGRLMEDLPPLETVSSTAPIREALGKMCSKEYSQLPVIEDNSCIGSITSDSILRQLQSICQKGKQGLGFMDWPVKAFVDKNVRYVSVDDDLVKHVEWMAENGFVLIGGPSKPEGIITNYDLVLFLKRKTEPFLLLREIETCLRYIVSRKLPEDKLKEALALIKTPYGSQPATLEELTLDNLRQLICTGANWEKLKEPFVDRNKTNKRLETICKLRNQILHFRGRLLASHLVQLKMLRDHYVKLATILSKSQAK